jgi:hypothetical protein
LEQGDDQTFELALGTSPSMDQLLQTSKSEFWIQDDAAVRSGICSFQVKVRQIS